MSKQVSYKFGPFQLCPGEQQLLHDGRPVALTFKAFQTLQVLVSNSGRLLDKSEIMAKVWPDVVTEEGNLAVTISTIRKALGETSRRPRYIQTVFRRGYRFTAGETACLEGREPGGGDSTGQGSGQGQGQDSWFTPGLA